MVAVARGELLRFNMTHSRVKCPNFPLLKHGKLWLGACCGGPTAAYCGNGGRSMIELLLLLLLLYLLLLKLLQLELWAIAPILLLLRSARTTTASTWEEHRYNYHCQWIQASSSLSYYHRPQQRPSLASLDQWQNSPIHCRRGWEKDPDILAGGR
jgi:hypothetical protein